MTTQKRFIFSFLLLTLFFMGSGCEDLTPLVNITVNSPDNQETPEVTTEEVPKTEKNTAFDQFMEELAKREEDETPAKLVKTQQEETPIVEPEPEPTTELSPQPAPTPEPTSSPDVVKTQHAASPQQENQQEEVPATEPEPTPTPEPVETPPAIPQQDENQQQAAAQEESFLFETEAEPTAEPTPAPDPVKTQHAASQQEAEQNPVQQEAPEPTSTPEADPAPMPEQDPTPEPPPAPEPDPAPAQAMSDYISELFAAINNYRTANGLSALRLDANLSTLAAEHNTYMQGQGTLSHDNFQVRFDASGRGSCVENVGWNYQTGQAMFDGWRNSPGHDENMRRERIDDLGLAKNGAYVTFFACQAADDSHVYNGPESDAYATAMLPLINQYRAENGLGPVALDESLNTLAREHNVYMQAQGELSHDNFEARFNRANRQACVENVGWNYPDAASQLQGWKDSPGHNVNLLKDFITILGLEKLGPYATFFACQ